MEAAFTIVLFDGWHSYIRSLNRKVDVILTLT